MSYHRRRPAAFFFNALRRTISLDALDPPLAHPRPDTWLAQTAEHLLEHLQPRQRPAHPCRPLCSLPQEMPIPSRRAKKASPLSSAAWCPKVEWLRVSATLYICGSSLFFFTSLVYDMFVIPQVQCTRCRHFSQLDDPGQGGTALCSPPVRPLFSCALGCYPQ